MLFLSTLLFSSLFSIVAQAKVYECKMNGHIKIDGQPMNITIRMQVGLWGYGSVKSGSYSYTVADGRAGEGQLVCASKVDRQQICLPKLQDAILDRVLIVPMWGPIVQVRGQAPIGTMRCEDI